MKQYFVKPLSLLSWLFLLVATCSLQACKGKKKLIQIDPEFSKYIEAYTSGVVSKKTSVRIQLAIEANTTHGLHEAVDADLFSFSPAVDGKAYWVDARTIEFKPTKDLKSNELYEISFKLNKVLQVPSKFKTFKFNLQTIQPNFIVEENGLRSSGKDKMQLSGQVLTADVEESATIEKILTAHLEGSALSIKWQHNEANKTHGFLIEQIARKKQAGSLVLAWDGRAYNMPNKDNKSIAIPAIGDFKVLEVKVVQEQEQYASVLFSDAIMIGQQLEGLIQMSNQENLSYTILGSEVRVYASNKLDGNYAISIYEGIQNEWGEKLTKPYVANVYFENKLPAVKIHGKGVVLPNSGGKLVLPFEATNLKAVDVSIVKIYEQNVPQFFQTNQLDGDANLRRVARPLVQARVNLDDDKTLNLHKKNRFLLDIDKYLKTEPGAIYRVFIGFRPAYSLYACASGNMEKTNTNEDDAYYDEEGLDGVDEDDQFWNKYDSYYPYGYDWEQRDNPCANGYYSKERFAYRNIISTNIGLTAKRGNDQQLFVAANNLVNTDPIGSVELTVIDYQQQVIGKGTTNSDGIATITLKRKPYLLIAKKGTEKSYLRLDDGTALSLAKFDVDGAEVKNGLKGFIYGERGVWRPGDSLFLGFIVEDKQKKLPKDHPIEMELISSKGQLYKRLVTTNNEEGFHVFRTATDVAAPTGNWLCRVKIGGAIFDKKIKIETIMPNRLKIDINFNGLKALGKNATTQATLTSTWLFGAAAQNLKARVDAQLYATPTVFEQYKNYVFDNPTSSFTTQSKTVFDGSLNANGMATIQPNFETGTQAPGMLLANLMIKVFEPGGNFSTDNVSMPYHPYSSYVGVQMPKTSDNEAYLKAGQSHAFSLVDVNTNGVAMLGSSKVEVELYKIQWRWWWDNSGESLSNFTQDNYNKLLKKQTIELINGKGVYTIQTDASDYGRYLLLAKDTRSGHVSGKIFYIEDDSWRTRVQNNDEVSNATMLSFATDKTTYNIGEEVKLTIPSAANGKALISIETGTKVLKTYWVNTTAGETKYQFKVEKEMTPNVFVHISLLQPHAQTVNDLPIRMYGVLPIKVEDKTTILHPIIKINDVIKPQQNTAITISEQKGQSMNYVVAIVDEGLLDLTRFKTPNPHENFYAKEALGVKSFDIYDYVIGAWGGELERILTIGGDAANDLASKTRKANRFKPVVQFMGPFKSSGSAKTHQFVLPQYMGSVRVMVIAANKGAYGAAEKSVKVKAPLMILPTIPRVVGPGEEITVPITTFAETKGQVNFKCAANEYFDVLTPTSSIALSKAEGLAYIKLRVKNKVGIGKINIAASLGANTTKYDTEIDVRNPNAPITQITEFALQPRQSITTNVQAIGAGAETKAIIELSSIPAINLHKRLNYLIQYPHGCIEQTTSAVFPQIMLSQLMELSAQQKTMIDAYVRKAIVKIQNFQTVNGGFSYWPGQSQEDEWGTNYAGHFLLEASTKGYSVSSSLLQQWKAYQRSKAQAWNITTAAYYGTDLTQAYRLYLLALAKAPELGAMNRLKEYKFISPEAKWRLAAAYQLAGQSQIALQLMSGLSTNFAARSYAGISYGSDLRDMAMALETLVLLNRKMEAEPLLRTIAAKLAQDSWYSTQTTAYSLIAIAKYMGNNNNGKRISVVGSAGAAKVNTSSNAPIVQQTAIWQNDRAAIQLKNTGNSVVFLRVVNQGQPFSNQVIPAYSNPSVLQMSVVYLSSTGAALDISKLKQGTDFVAKVTIKNPGQRGMYAEMALSQIFPSGWEILNTRLYNNEGPYKSSPSKYMDIRDDRVYHYFDIRQNETLTFYVQLNAAYLGKYFFGGATCEAMYDHSIAANTQGLWVEVIE